MIRIVKLTFKLEHIQDFFDFIAPYREKINAVEGCHGVQMLHDKFNPNLIFTYSNWDREESLEAYRQSELFQHVWSTVKVWFGDKPEAWSLEEI
jgi:quinol monooxygenase YgiN